MDSQWPSIEMPRRYWKLSDVAYCETRESRCYIVLTQDYFGWRLSSFPTSTLFLSSMEFQAIPLAVIDRIVFSVSTPGHSASFSLHCTNCSEPLAFTVGLPYRWAEVLQRSGLSVIGAETFRLTSVKGFLRNYGWISWFAVYSAFWVLGSCFLTLARVPAAGLFLILTFALFPVFNLFLFLLLNLWKQRRTRLSDEEKSKSAPALFEGSTPKPPQGSPERNED